MEVWTSTLYFNRGNIPGSSHTYIFAAVQHAKFREAGAVYLPRQCTSELQQMSTISKLSYFLLHLLKDYYSCSAGRY
jgi:hypothetical protein